jgi:hypothetical protein
MSTRFSLAAASAALMVAGALNAVPGVVYNDAANDIDPGITTGGGTLDLLSMEVSHTATDIVFSLTVNGSVNSVDWGKFMIGISTPGGDKTTTGNGWSRPINFASNGGMNYWVGSWVDSGGGSQLWSNGASGWSGPASNAGFSFSGNNITYTISRAAIGMSGDGTFFFDAIHFKLGWPLHHHQRLLLHDSRPRCDRAGCTRRRGGPSSEGLSPVSLILSCSPMRASPASGFFFPKSPLVPMQGPRHEHA